MAVIWVEVGPWGYQATLPADVVATVSRRGAAGLFRWSLSHPDLPVRADGISPTLLGARDDIIAAAPAFALAIADALDARAAVISARAAACRNWSIP